MTSRVLAVSYNNAKDCNLPGGLRSHDQQGILTITNGNIAGALPRP